MIRLDTASRKLQALLGAPISSSELDVVVSFRDRSRSPGLGTELSRTTGATPVDICRAPPDSATLREVSFISVCNNDSAAATVTLRVDDDGVARILLKVTLGAGESLSYSSASGWTVIGTSGEVKTTAGSVPWQTPGAIGSTTPNTGAFTTLAATGQITSTLANGTAPLVVASSTKVANLNADLLDGADWAAPAAIGSGTPNSGSFTTLNTTGRLSANGVSGLTNSPLEATAAVSNGSQLTSAHFLDSTGIGAGVGGAVSFGGKYTGSTYTTWAAIQGAKANATDGNYSGRLLFFTRNHGGTWAERLQINNVGTLGLGISPHNSWVADSSSRYIQVLDRVSFGATQHHATVATNSYWDGANWRYLASSVAATQYYNGTGTHVLRTSTGSATADGLITWQNVLEADVAGKITLPKGQLQFPAAQNASADSNCLDDYEEGTFTAILRGVGSDPTTSVQATAAYTKVGRKVAFTIMFDNVTTTGASGHIYVTGLPFSSGAGAYIGTAMVYLGATFVSSTPVGYIHGTQFDLYCNVSNGAWQTVTHNAGVGRYFWLSGHYHV